MTVEFWFKLGATTGNFDLLNRGATGSQGIVMTIQTKGASPCTNFMKISVEGVNDICGGTEPSDTSTWHFFAATWANGSYAVYIDSAAGNCTVVSVSVCSGAQTFKQAASAQLCIGSGETATCRRVLMALLMQR